VFNVLFKIRSISKLSRKSNIIHHHVLKLIKEDSTFKHNIFFIVDFFVRWNSTYQMLKRFKTLKRIVISLTNSPEEIQGIKLNQSVKLKNWLLSSDEWIIVDTLEKILFPFFKATELASFQNYPTLAISLVIKNSLQSHLCMSGSSDEALIKQILTERLLYHLDTKISKKQKEYTQE
jgi:hypothetical protein